MEIGRGRSPRAGGGGFILGDGRRGWDGGGGGEVIWESVIEVDGGGGEGKAACCFHPSGGAVEYSIVWDGRGCGVRMWRVRRVAATVKAVGLKVMRAWVCGYSRTAKGMGWRGDVECPSSIVRWC